MLPFIAASVQDPTIVQHLGGRHRTKQRIGHLGKLGGSSVNAELGRVKPETYRCPHLPLEVAHM